MNFYRLFPTKKYKLKVDVNARRKFFDTRDAAASAVAVAAAGNVAVVIVDGTAIADVKMSSTTGIVNIVVCQRKAIELSWQRSNVACRSAPKGLASSMKPSARPYSDSADHLINCK